MSDPAIDRWRSYPPPNAPRVPCVFCDRSFTVPCGSEDQAKGCGNAKAKAKAKAERSHV